MHYKIPVIFFSVLSIVWLIGSSYCYVCNVRDNCKPGLPVDENIVEKEAFEIPKIEIKDGDSLDITASGNFYFLYNTDSLMDFQNDQMTWDALSAYLSDHPEKNLVVTGHYLEEESSGAKLGLNRSEAFVNIFSKEYGLSDDRFKAAFEVEEGAALNTDSTRVYGALSFAFNVDKSRLDDKVSEDMDLEALVSDLKKARRVYFDFGSSIMKANPALHQFFTDLKFYLEKRKGSKITLTGHTDNVGSPEKNNALSMERAKDVRRYLVENNGFKSSDFNLEAKGETMPIASNETDGGRAKNRRVEIKLAN
jgi:OOP family OmpA-OmpF porin